MCGLALAVCLAVAGCPGEEELADPADLGGEDVAEPSDVLPELPSFTLECSECHAVAELRTSNEPEPVGAAPRDWLTAHGAGLVRLDSVVGTEPPRLDLPWTRRGSHDDQSMADCAGCHPVRDDGLGHGVRTYPTPGDVFSPGVACSDDCHAWLPKQVLVVGFTPAEGPAPIYEGSLRPADLLAGAQNGHSTLWKQGARPAEAGDYAISAFNPGCGGCHNLAAEAHGVVMGCLDCHRFGGWSGPLHKLHDDAITARASAVDADFSAAGGSPCAYCHAEDDEPMSRSLAACYGCHLSGHQPMNAAGEAHFWPSK